jgi:hypothetical protein
MRFIRHFLAALIFIIGIFVSFIAVTSGLAALVYADMSLLTVGFITSLWTVLYNLPLILVCIVGALLFAYGKKPAKDGPGQKDSDYD